MKHSKHAAVKKINKKTKRIIIIISIIVILIVSLICFISLRNKNNSKKNEPVAENIVEEEPTNEVTEQVQESFEMVDTSDMPSTKGGYGVLGKIVAERIGLDNYILNKTTNASLNLAVTWFWGPDDNNRTVNDPRKYVYNWT